MTNKVRLKCLSGRCYSVWFQILFFRNCFRSDLFPCLSYWLFLWNLVTLLMFSGENNTPHCFRDNYFVVVFMFLWLLISLLCSFLFFLLSPNIELHPLFFIFYRLFLDDLSWSQSLYPWYPKIYIFSHFLTPNLYVQQMPRIQQIQNSIYIPT